MNQRAALSEHWFYLRLAIVFLTRLPIQIKGDVPDEALNKASGYFGFVGLLLGLVFTAVFVLIEAVLPVSVAIVLAMIVSIMLTGAFHEDGLADTADGLGGGWQVEQKLAIMKDSRLGTYGACALFSALALKFVLLWELAALSSVLLMSSVILAQSVSRALAVSLIGSMPYVQLDELSKTKPLAKSLAENSGWLLVLSSILALLLANAVLEVPFLFVVSVLFVLLLVRHVFKRFMLKQLGGYTGDVLGAAQQLFELTLLTGALAYHV